MHPQELNMVLHCWLSDMSVALHVFKNSDFTFSTFETNHTFFF